MADASLTDPPSAMRYPLPRGCPKKHPVGRTVPGEPPLSYENANVGSAGTPRPTFRHAPGTDSTYTNTRARRGRASRFATDHGRGAEQRPDPGDGAQSQTPPKRPKEWAILRPIFQFTPVRMLQVTKATDDQPNEERSAQEKSRDHDSCL